MKGISKIVVACGVVGLLLGGCGAGHSASSTPRAAVPMPALDSWNEGASRNAIEGFVKRVTTPGAPGFIAPEERIAVFDNDGTLWAEQPMYFQFLFAVDCVKAMASANPQWKTQEPFASILRGDLNAALAGGEKSILEIVMATHAGMTTEAFDAVVKEWIATARHPTTGKLYSEMVYQPMVELLGYLRAHGFKTYIVSGGGVEFMRAWAQRVYGIPPEQIIGSSGALAFARRNGVPVLVKQPKVEFIDDKEGKPIGIQQRIGRRPVAAFGNSDGDLQMLQWTAAGPGERLCVYVHHTDAQREWAYDRESHVGRLEAGLKEAAERGWVVVDMKADWKRVFGFDER